MKRMTSRLTVLVVALAAAALALVAPASATTNGDITPQALGCGTDRLSDIVAVGTCSGSGTWRLAISCTWGYSGATAWITQNGGAVRLTKKCGWGSLRDEWIEVDRS